MSRTYLKNLYKELGEQIKKSKEFSQENKPAPSGSPQQSPDASNTPPQENLNDLYMFYQELDGAVKIKKPQTVVPICYVTIKYENMDKPASFFVVDKPVFVSGQKFVSIDSSLGKLLAGKKVGDHILCHLNNTLGEVDADFEIISIE